MQRDHEPRRITYTEIADALETNINGLDPQRVSKLIDLRRLRNVKATQLAREQKRLARKLGRGHERVAAVARQKDANKVLIANLERETERASTATPEARADAWIVHGYVRDTRSGEGRRPTVTAHDAKGDRLEAFGSAETDEKGYFKLVVTSLDEPKRTAGEIAVADREVKRPLVYLHVSGSSRDYRDPRPLAPAAGQVDYREIVVPPDDPADVSGKAPEDPDEESAPDRNKSGGFRPFGRKKRRK